MTQGSQGQREPDLAEHPTRSAQLKIDARLLGSAEGTVPSGEAHHLVTTFGMVGCAVTGTAGAVITLRIDQHLAGIALAELALALVIAMLVAAHSRRADQAHD
jgi:hypothetical protein